MIDFKHLSERLRDLDARIGSPVCLEAADAIEQLLARVSPAPAVESAQVKDLEWHPRIGDPVEASESFLSRYGEWARVPLWVVGVAKDRGVDGLNISVSDEWPVRDDGNGYTDGFYINRADGVLDDLKPRASLDLATDAEG